MILTWLSGGHNGANLQFGPDGMLYVSTGDATAPNPPDGLNTGQDNSDLLSAVLRIDVDRKEAGKAYRVPPDNPYVGRKNVRPEIWAWGLRNPWRFSFDRGTGQLFAPQLYGWEMAQQLRNLGNNPFTRQPIAAILPLVEDTECDGIELNFGCPHGMSERGMGSAVGQVPEYIEMVTRWCKQNTAMPVIVKLTPNITDIRYPAQAANNGGADAVSLINTINSITSVNLDSFAPEPTIDGKGAHGGYCGPAVKPIAMNMVAEIARDYPQLLANDDKVRISFSGLLWLMISDPIVFLTYGGIAGAVRRAPAPDGWSRGR